MKYDSMSIMNKCNVDILSEDQLIYLQVSQNKCILYFLLDCLWYLNYLMKVILLLLSR